MISRWLIFIWLGSKMPDYGRFCIQSFQEVNPSFEVMAIEEPDVENTKNEDLKDCMSLINSDGNNLYKRMVNRNFAKKHLSSTRTRQLTAISDAFRLYLLNKYGGIYLDLDTFPVKPFDDKLLSYKGFVPYYKKNRSDWFFIGLPPGFISKGMIHGYAFDSEIHRIVLLDRAYKIFKANLDTNVKKFFSCKLEHGSHVLPLSFFPEYYIDHFKIRSWKK